MHRWQIRRKRQKLAPLDTTEGVLSTHLESAKALLDCLGCTLSMIVNAFHTSIDLVALVRRSLDLQFWVVWLRLGDWEILKQPWNASKVHWRPDIELPWGLGKLQIHARISRLECCAMPKDWQLKVLRIGETVIFGRVWFLCCQIPSILLFLNLLQYPCRV